MKKTLLFVALPIILVVAIVLVLFANYTKSLSLPTNDISKYNAPQNISESKSVKIIDSLTQERIAEYKVSIADDDDERMLGLMFVKELPVDQGMFFIFEEDNSSGFWMKNCEIPLDIIFIDKDYKIVDIAENAQPCNTDHCEVYKSEGVYRFVLEVNGGESMKLNIQDGHIIELF
jgi:uncharacterized membrane protein (UPF0127 family)